MTPQQALVVAALVLMVAGAIALGARYATPSPPAGSSDDGDDLDAHFSAYWWM
jgi:hypothetical protein